MTVVVSGSWQVTGDAVRFASDGSLIDGQHRLAAIVQAGVPIELFVIRGLDIDTQEVMDSGARRQAHDALSLRGHQGNTRLLASAARLALSIETGGYGAINGKQSAFTTSEIAAFIEDHPSMESYIGLAASTARQLDCSPTVVCYAMWRLYSIAPEQADDFFLACRDGIGLEIGDPVLALRRRFAEARRHRERVSIAATLSLIFRAWNARREGKALHRMAVVNKAGDVVIPEAV